MDDDLLRHHMRLEFDVMQPLVVSKLIDSATEIYGYPGLMHQVHQMQQMHNISRAITVTTTKWTAFCLATEKGHNEIVQLLAKKGAKRELFPTTYSST